MRSAERFLGMPVAIGLLCAAGFGQQTASGVSARFNLSDPAVGPFPSDQFTVPDPSQITSLRVALPTPDCSLRRSDCNDIAVINTLDGFSLQPRIALSFDGAIDVTTITSKSVLLVAFGNSTPARIIGINQVFWDPPSKTLYVASEELLAQHSQFAIIATAGILDTTGKPLQESVDFAQFINSGTGDYHDRLLAGLTSAASLGIPRGTIVTASVFTTLSATAILEKIRDQVHAAVVQPASFLANGVRTVFSRTTVSSIVIHQQTRVSPPGFTDATVNLAPLERAPGSVGAIAFGTYLSPDYETEQRIIPPVGTLTGKPTVRDMNTVAFDLILPRGSQPAKGWPVAIFGHGNGRSKEDVFNVASILAAHGFATISINVAGHGFGVLGTMDVNLATGQTVTLSAGGRGVDLDVNNTIQNNEGSEAAGALSIVGNRDAWIQTAADSMQLIRMIQAGMDIDGDGKPDIDASRIYYFGASQGGNYGTDLMAVESNIRAAALGFVGGPRTEYRRLAPAGRSLLGLLLQQRIPSLINSPGLTQIGGVAAQSPFFNENKPLRNLPAVINDVAGAVEIQQVFDYQEWVSTPGDPVTYAPTLRKFPLPGMTARPVLLLIAKEDQTVINPATTSLLRAADLMDVTTNFRADLAYAEDPDLPKNPHYFYALILNNPTILKATVGALEQIAVFFESDGVRIIHPDPADLFEVPMKLPLSESVEYLTGGPLAQPPVDAATYQTALSPGTLFSVFASNSVTSEQSAGPGALPTRLGGVMVTINGILAPLLYVGPAQINGQLPYETSENAVMQVIANGISATPTPFAVSPTAPKIFSMNGSVCIAQNEDGTLNSGTNPIAAGHSVTVYLIGMGAVSPAVPTGVPAPATPPASPSAPVTALFAGRSITPTSIGLVPGYVGVGQVKLSVPAGTAEGFQDFSVTIGSVTSNKCQIAVRK